MAAAAAFRLCLCDPWKVPRDQRSRRVGPASVPAFGGRIAQPVFGLGGLPSPAQLWRQVEQMWVPFQSAHPPAFWGAKWRFIAAGPSFLSSVFVRIFMQMSSFLFVSLPTTFLNLLTLQSQISLKTHLPASPPPSPCPAAPSAPSAACSRPRPHCAFRLVKSTGSTFLTGSREVPFSLKRLSLRLRLSSLPCFLPFLQSLSSPLPAHACPVSVRIHQCSAAGSPV